MNRQEQISYNEIKLRLRQLEHHHNALKGKYAKLVNDYKRLSYRLNSHKENKPKVDVKIQNVKNAILEVFGVDVDTKTRHRPIVTGRTAYCNYLRQNTSLALVDIARTLYTLPHHATIIHSINQHQDWMTYDKAYKDLYEKFEDKLNEIQSNETKS